MKLRSLILKPIFHFTPNPPKFIYFQTHPFTSQSEISICNEVLTILDTINPMESALSIFIPYLSPHIVTSVIQEQQNPKLGFRFFLWAMRRKRFRSWDSHNLVIDMLVRDNGTGIGLYWEALEEVKNLGVKIPSRAFVVLIAGYWKMNEAEKAVECFGRMKDFDCKPDLFTYNMVLHIMVKKEVILLALAVYNMMLKSNSYPNCSTFSILIDGLCKDGKTKDALKLFDEMTERGIMPDKITNTVILFGLCQAKRTDDAYRLFNAMKNSGSPVDFVTYNALLNGVCKLGKMEEALCILKDFKKDGFVLGLRGYAYLVDGLFRARRFNEAHELFQKLHYDNITPDLILYTIMIRGLSKAGMMNDALKMLRDMTDRGVVPDTHCYNTLIKGFCDMGLLDQARSLKLEISELDSFPNTYTYTILICGMCKNGLVGEARQIFNDMEKIGCFPSVVTFNALIDGLCKAGELEEARLLFYKMEIGRNPSLFLRLSQGADRVLDSASLQTMVERLCESGLILKAYRLLMQLADSGVVPTITTYNILINGFCKEGKINGAFKLFKELQLKGLSADSITYGTLIDGLQRVDREDDAFVVLEQMTKNGCKPHSAVYKSLMTWSCRKRKLSVAFGLWLKYLRSLPDREEEAIKSVEENFERGELEKAVRELLEMDFKLRDFDSAPYTIWLIGLCQVHKPNEALNIFAILDEFSINVSAPSCVMLINSLCKEGHLDLAIKIFLYTVEKGLVLRPRICNQLLKCLLRSREKQKKMSFAGLSRVGCVRPNLDIEKIRMTGNTKVV
ncbi:hypothetical protein LguiA_024573 [Lonicera macranthoides]